MTEPGNERLVARLSHDRAALLDRCRTFSSGIEWASAHSALADELVRGVVAEMAAKTGGLPAMSIVATGGYGRAELSPYSDADLTIIPLHENDPEIDSAIRLIFRGLHDAFHDFGITVGYAYRLIADAPGLDAESMTSLLDARLVAGEAEPMNQLLALLWETFPTGDFLVAKLREREADRTRTNDTPLAVEPDLKVGAGGLRCVHTANWMGMAIGDRSRRPTAAYEAVLRARNLLHVASGRANDRFSRARQAEVADLIGADMLAMSSALAENLESNDHLYQHAVRELRGRRFQLGPNLWAANGSLRVDDVPTLGDAAVAVALAAEIGIEAGDFKVPSSEKAKGNLLLQTISRGEHVLRTLDRCGLLASMLPELQACRYLMPSDSSHSYTVYEHSMRVVRNLDNPPEGFLSEIRANLASSPVLFLAALMHDAGKAIPGERHSITGEQLVRDVSQRWGLERSIADDVAWLVREHLTMSHVIRLRDVYHQATAHDFAETVRTPERLSMLTLLTWADIAAVSEEAWTPVQEDLLKELYDRTMWVLESDASDLPDPDLYRRRLRRAAEPDDQGPKLAEFVDSLPGHYLLSNDSATIYSHFGFYRKALEGEPSLDLQARPETGSSELTVCCPDASGLLNRILGVIYAFDLSLHGLRASTTQSTPHIAIDVFSVSFAGRPIPQATAARFIQGLLAVLSRDRTVEEVLTEHGKDPARRQEDFRWQFVPGDPAILEFTAPRGRGMPYRLSHMILREGWNVLAARVGQWAGYGTAAFYIERADGEPIGSDQVERALAQKV
ncbi:MAG: Bifunctional uridylyltransferase/uridylyl-removing enzyme [Fimbriimonadaceae bacterium]|nr:Bifunctional uridylyltransferase/uridylyl-removing enzyme [Fimbriimonadaceae bacterium]